MVIFHLEFLKMDAIPETLMSEELCGGLVACGLVCFLPLRNWWRSLKAETRAKIPLVISVIVALSDTGLDWYVLVGWYEKGLSRIATALLLLILIQAAFFALNLVVVMDAFEDYSRVHSFVFILLTCFGLGNILLAFMVVRQSPPDADLYYVSMMRKIINFGDL